MVRRPEACAQHMVHCPQNIDVGVVFLMLADGGFQSQGVCMGVRVAGEGMYWRTMMEGGVFCVTGTWWSVSLVFALCRAVVTSRLQAEKHFNLTLYHISALT